MGNAPKWHTLGQSVRGASHLRSGLPNQDAVYWYPKSGEGPPLIVAVSDGHGSPRSFRSDVGSRFAVEQTVALILDLLNIADSLSTLSAVKRLVEERLPQELVRRWRASVDAHIGKHPFTQKELDGVEANRGAKARREAEANPYLAYGATILGVLVTRDFILSLQLGDGDILNVMADNTITRPVPGDERLFANATTSLCTKNSWRDVRYRFQPLYGQHPALIMLSSDGYANSFVNDKGFLKVATDILDILREDGVVAVADNLEDWLTDASKSGSGDDITLALLFRDDIPAPSPSKKAVEASAKTKPVAKPQTVSEPLAEVAQEEIKLPIETVAEASPTSAPTVGAESTTDAVIDTPAPPMPSEEPAAEPMVVEDTNETIPNATVASSSGDDETRKRKRRIKDAAGPYEPSKKAPTIYYED